MKKTILSILAFLTLLLFNCSIFKSAEIKAAEKKMNFEFSKLDKNGLRKSKGTSLAYEFCIPNEEEKINQIKKIDETIKLYHSSQGRIGCGQNEVLCIGETANKDYKSILIKLTKLPYVKNINESFFE